MTVMNSYRIDFKNNDVETTESVRSFDNDEGMSFILPNDTYLLLTHSFVREMNERIDDILAD